MSSEKLLAEAEANSSADIEGLAIFMNSLLSIYIR
jgi:hypothetical protein